MGPFFVGALGKGPNGLAFQPALLPCLNLNNLEKKKIAFNISFFDV